MMVANMVEYILVDKVADDMERIKEKISWYKWCTNVATLTKHSHADRAQVLLRPPLCPAHSVRPPQLDLPRVLF